jgi:Flp pilus assembly protein CpaB
MKKLTLVLCVVVAMAFVGMVFAQTATPPQKQIPPPTKPVEKPQTPAQPAKPMPKALAAKPAEVKKMTEKKMMGVVVSVDAVANTIVVKRATKAKGEFTFEATPTTKIMVAGKEAKLADIMKDSKIAVIYKLEGKKRVAIAIKCQ